MDKRRARCRAVSVRASIIAPEFMRALSSQQPRFLNNLCAFVCLSDVCLSVRAEGANLCRKLASASYANFDTLLKGVPKRVPKITST